MRTKPIDVPVDTYTSPQLTSGALPASGAGLTVGGGALTRGRIWGLRGFLHNNATPKVGQTGGTVTVVLYRDVGLTEELAAVTLDFTSRSSDSTQFSSAIRFFAQPFVKVTGVGAAVGDYLDVTVDVEAN